MELKRSPVTLINIKPPEIKIDNDHTTIIKNCIRYITDGIDNMIVDSVKEIITEKYPNATDVIIFDKTAVLKMFELYCKEGMK